jgi:hypothetical protein
MKLPITPHALPDLERLAVPHHLAVRQLVSERADSPCDIADIDEAATLRLRLARFNNDSPLKIFPDS